MILAPGQWRISHWSHFQEEEEGFHQLPTFYFLQNHAAPAIHSFQTVKQIQLKICKYACYNLYKMNVKRSKLACGKHMGIPPRIAFGALKIAYR